MTEEHLPPPAISSTLEFKDKWKNIFPWVRFDNVLGKMFCSYCIINFLTRSNNMIIGTYNLQKCTLREHSKITDHKLALEHHEKQNNIAKCEREPMNFAKRSLDQFFKTNREKLQFFDLVPLFKNCYWLAKENYL